MLPPQEGPEPGYIACVCVLATQSRANAIAALSRISFPSQMDMSLKPPRHAASKRAPFRGDPQMTKKEALTSDGVRTVTIGAHLADK